MQSLRITFQIFWNFPESLVTQKFLTSLGFSRIFLPFLALNFLKFIFYLKIPLKLSRIFYQGIVRNEKSFCFKTSIFEWKEHLEFCSQNKTLVSLPEQMTFSIRICIPRAHWQVSSTEKWSYSFFWIHPLFFYPPSTLFHTLLFLW